MNDTLVSNVNLLVGFFLPPLVAALVQSAWPSWAKACVAFLACVAAAAAVLYAQGHLSPTMLAADFFGTVVLLLVVAKSSYEAFWKPSQIAPTIEEATNLTGRPRG